MAPSRRHLIQAAGACLLAPPALRQRAQSLAAVPGVRPPTLRPRRLQPGDTVAVVNPSGAIYERAPYALAFGSLMALGFKVKEAPHLRARYGHLAGTDAQRAGDINAMFADPEVQGILAMTGGSGGSRILPLIDYAAVRRNPKFLGGFSDLTALVNAVHARTGLITFHCPMAGSEWNEFSVRHFRGTVMDAQAVPLANPVDRDDALKLAGAFDGLAGVVHLARGAGSRDGRQRWHPVPAAARGAVMARAAAAAAFCRVFTLSCASAKPYICLQ